MPKEEKQKLWDMAFGLIKIDELEPSEEMIELAKKEVNNEINLDKIINILMNKYKVEENVWEIFIFMKMQIF